MFFCLYLFWSAVVFSCLYCVSVCCGVLLSVLCIGLRWCLSVCTVFRSAVGFFLSLLCFGVLRHSSVCTVFQLCCGLFLSVPCFGLLWCFSAPTAFRFDVVSVWLHCVSVCCGVFSVRTAFRCAQAFFCLYSSVFRLCCGVVFCGYIIIITIIIDIINVIIVILVLIIIIVPIVTIVVLMAQVGSCPFVTIARVLIVTMSLSWHRTRVMARHRTRVMARHRGAHRRADRGQHKIHPSRSCAATDSTQSSAQARGGEGEESERAAQGRRCQRCWAHRPRRLVMCLWGCEGGVGSGCAPPQGPCFLVEFEPGRGTRVDCLPPWPPWPKWKARRAVIGDRAPPLRTLKPSIARARGGNQGAAASADVSAAAAAATSIPREAGAEPMLRGQSANALVREIFTLHIMTHGPPLTRLARFGTRLLPSTGMPDARGRAWQHVGRWLEENWKAEKAEQRLRAAAVWADRLRLRSFWIRWVQGAEIYPPPLVVSSDEDEPAPRYFEDTGAEPAGQRADDRHLRCYRCAVRTCLVRCDLCNVSVCNAHSIPFRWNPPPDSDRLAARMRLRCEEADDIRPVGRRTDQLLEDPEGVTIAGLWVREGDAKDLRGTSNDWLTYMWRPAYEAHPGPNAACLHNSAFVPQEPEDVFAAFLPLLR